MSRKCASLPLPTIRTPRDVGVVETELHVALVEREASPLRHTLTSCKVISTSDGSKLTPELPAAERMRPQFGSEPAMAVLTSGDIEIERQWRRQTNR